MTSNATLSMLFIISLLITVLVGIFAFVVSKKSLRTTLLAMLVTFFILASASALHLWEDYSQTHFLGTYNPEGGVSLTSRHGLLLILDAWPLWIIPTTLFSILVFAITWYVIVPLTLKNSFTHSASRQSLQPHSSGNISDKLTLEAIKQATAETTSTHLSDQIKAQTFIIAARENENAALRKITQAQVSEIAYLKELLSREG